VVRNWKKTEENCAGRKVHNGLYRLRRRKRKMMMMIIMMTMMIIIIIIIIHSFFI